MILPIWRTAALILLASLTACDEREPDRFAKWQKTGTNNADAAALQRYLNDQRVGNVIPLHQLLRSDTKWRLCGADAFDVPPKSLWPNMVPTLRLIRDEVEPMIGPVEAQSVFRSPAINRCIRGASQSYHLRFHAIDMRPDKGVTRTELIKKLCKLHAARGKALNMGLGIYSGTRFHIDTAGYRRWGHDHRAGTSPCIAIKPPAIPARQANRR
jgi:Peptidase M15